MIPAKDATFFERVPAMIFWTLVLFLCLPFVALALVFDLPTRYAGRDTLKAGGRVLPP